MKHKPSLRPLQFETFSAAQRKPTQQPRQPVYSSQQIAKTMPNLSRKTSPRHNALMIDLKNGLCGSNQFSDNFFKSSLRNECSPDMKSSQRHLNNRGLARKENMWSYNPKQSNTSSRRETGIYVNNSYIPKQQRIQTQQTREPLNQRQFAKENNQFKQPMLRSTDSGGLRPSDLNSIKIPQEKKELYIEGFSQRLHENENLLRTDKFTFVANLTERTSVTEVEGQLTSRFATQFDNIEDNNSFCEQNLAIPYEGMIMRLNSSQTKTFIAELNMTF